MIEGLVELGIGELTPKRAKSIAMTTSVMMNATAVTAGAENGTDGAWDEGEEECELYDVSFRCLRRTSKRSYSRQ